MHVNWKKLFLLLCATPLCGAAQIPFGDSSVVNKYSHRPLPSLEDWGSQPASITEPEGTDDETRASSLDAAVLHPKSATDRFQWKPALAQYLLETSIQHGWRFATEKGTRDATASGPWFHDWIDSIGEKRGWGDGDNWHPSYVGHPLNGGIYCFIEQQNDPLYRRVEWGDGRIYWMSRLRATAFTAIASIQWKLGPMSEASLGNVELHSSPGFIDIVQTPGIGVMEAMGEDLIDRDFILRLEWTRFRASTIVAWATWATNCRKLRSSVNV